ncbi:AMP-binding protein [Streptomyces sp. NPDC003233]
MHDWARDHGPRTALVHGATRLTYFQLDRRVSRMAAGLRLRGVEPGKRVAVQPPNTREFVVAVSGPGAGRPPMVQPLAARPFVCAVLTAPTPAPMVALPTGRRT